MSLFDERQTIREVLLLEECRWSNFRWLLLHSQATDFHGGHSIDEDQGGRMLLAEEACLDGGCLETDEASARRSSRVEIVRLWADGFTDAARQYRASHSGDGVLAE